MQHLNLQKSGYNGSDIGWHYTEFSVWNQLISKQGLIPQPIPKHHVETFRREAPTVKKGTWLYRKRQSGLSLNGIICWHARKHGETKVVCLEVEWNRLDALVPGTANTIISISHRLTHEELIHHINEPAVILTKPIEVERIRLIEVYDLIDMMKVYEDWLAAFKH